MPRLIEQPSRLKAAGVKTERTNRIGTPEADSAKYIDACVPAFTMPSAHRDSHR